MTRTPADSPRLAGVVDAQVHVWRADTAEHAWPAESARYLRDTAVASSAEREPVGGDDVIELLDRHGVAGAVLVPPVFAGDDNSAALAAAEAHPERLWMMGRVPLDRRAGLAELDSWPEHPQIVGARLTFFWASHRAVLDAGGADWVWEAAAERGIPVAVLSPGRLGVIAEVARRHPELRIVVDHFGMDLEQKDAAALASIPELIALAPLENVAVKASTLPSYVTEPYPFPSLRDPIHRVYDAFGPRRIFWGSEATRLTVPYADALRQFTDDLDFLSDDDRSWILGRGIREWLGLG